MSFIKDLCILTRKMSEDEAEYRINIALLLEVISKSKKINYFELPDTCTEILSKWQEYEIKQDKLKLMSFSG